MENKLEIAKKLIVELLNHLPDSEFQKSEDWQWAWDSLYCASQDKVKDIRMKANNILKELEKTK